MKHPYISGILWDDGNREKCQKHGVTTQIIEDVLSRPVVILPDESHSQIEQRFNAIGQTEEKRYLFIVFTLRRKDNGIWIRPISVRYMHKKEVTTYEKENPHILH